MLVPKSVLFSVFFIAYPQLNLGNMVTMVFQLAKIWTGQAEGMLSMTLV